jgi:hypothetical protein
VELDGGAVTGEAVHQVAELFGAGREPVGVVGVSEEADHPAHGGQGVGPGRLDPGQGAFQGLGTFGGNETCCLGLDDDAGNVVGDHIVELSGQFQALVASGGVDSRPAVRVEGAQPHPDAERATPEHYAEECEREDVCRPCGDSAGHHDRDPGDGDDCCGAGGCDPDTCSTERQ